MIIKTYKELSQLRTFEERYEYLRIGGIVGEDTFGFDRYLNQIFYHCKEWERVKHEVIVRDQGWDLGLAHGFEIVGSILVHHINPVTVEDIKERSELLLNPNYLISTSLRTHNAIHYGDKDLLPKPPVVRNPFDTCPWRH